jgi:S-adenosylmethionine:tRNA ribosyltransferase-isomerase
MRTDTFDYDLPAGLIAQDPLAKRDASRLMVVDRASGEISHHQFGDLPGFLHERDCLVVNKTRVLPARLSGAKLETGGRVELLLLENIGGDAWKAMTRGASLRRGAQVTFGDGKLMASVADDPQEGVIVVELAAGAGTVAEAIDECGRVPLPPYITHELADTERYQTVYAEREISAAAPTAGLHFTDDLLREVRTMGVSIAGLELAVGMDTFVPVREELVEDHRIHSEWFSLDGPAADAINAAHDSDGRRVAVGTTSVRVMETCAQDSGRLLARSGYTDLFVTPGYSFKAVDMLITNFHFPRSTLLMLVCAFGGTDLVLRAYREAVRDRYRFYSFGDAMLLA